MNQVFRSSGSIRIPEKSSNLSSFAVLQNGVPTNKEVKNSSLQNDSPRLATSSSSSSSSSSSTSKPTLDVDNLFEIKSPSLDKLTLIGLTSSPRDTSTSSISTLQ